MRRSAGEHGEDHITQRRTSFAELSRLPELRVQQVAGDPANELQQHLQRAAEQGDGEQWSILLTRKFHFTTERRTAMYFTDEGLLPAIRAP
jgi:hypothetical protein